MDEAVSRGSVTAKSLEDICKELSDRIDTGIPVLDAMTEATKSCAFNFRDNVREFAFDCILETVWARGKHFESYNDRQALKKLFRWHWPPGQNDQDATDHLISPTPFTWRDPAEIPRREWLYGKSYIRKFLSAIVAPGGAGKSSLIIAEALAMATGRNLIGEDPATALRVWLWNGEDPLDEMDRRITAICLHHGIKPEEFAGRLFRDSGRLSRICIAEETKQGTKIAEPMRERLIEQIENNGIDVMIVDPFVKSHNVSENDNRAIDAVARTWAEIADETNCSITLVHHTRKLAGSGGAVTADDGRGASAMKDATRVMRVLNSMTENEGAQAGIEAKHRYKYFQVIDGKRNMVPPIQHAQWFQLCSVPLGNGEGDAQDYVQAVEKWTPPNFYDGVTGSNVETIRQRLAGGSFRENMRAKNWAGLVVADVLKLDATDRAAKYKISMLLRSWVASGALRVVIKKDESRRERTFIDIGEEPIDLAPDEMTGAEQT